MTDIDSTAGAVGVVPAHYQGNGIQPFDVWDMFQPDPWTATAFKHLARCGRKGSVKNDLDKAKHYAQEALLRYQDFRLPFAYVMRIENSKDPEDIAKAFGLTGHVANAVVYLLRSRVSINPSACLEATIRYIDRALASA